MCKVILLFVFLGSYIGSISSFFFNSIIPVISISADDKYVSVIEGLTATLILSPFVGTLVYPIAIFFALIPAVASAILYWTILKYFVTQNPHPINRLLIGGGIGFFISLFYFSTGSIFHNENNYSHLMYFIPSGSLASAICSLCIKDSFYIRIIN